MKKARTIILLIIIFFILLSCRKGEYISSDPMPRIDTIWINPAEVTTSRVTYSSLFDKIEYIQIPTDSNYLIGKVDKLLVTDDYFFVMDRKISRSVFVFDRQGNKVVRINKTGNGPGNYIDMRDITFDKEKQEIQIREYMRKKLLYYNLDGNFLREFDIPYNSLRLQPVGNSFALCTDYNSGNKLNRSKKHADLILLDADKKTILSTANYFIPPFAKAVVITSEAQFSRLNDTLYSIKPDHCNIVYHATPNEIYPAYRIDFGSYSIDDRYWQKAAEEGMTYAKIDEYSNNLGLCESFRFLEGENFMSFVYKQYGEVYNVLYSKKTKNMHHIEKYQNDIDMVSMFYPIAIYDDKLYCLLSSEDVYNMREHLADVMPKEILNNVEEFGNPIISIFTLKPF